MRLRVVAFLDVLGFEQLVESVRQQELIDLYRQLQEVVCEHTTSSVFRDDARKYDEDPLYSPDEVSQAPFVNFLMASDSIVLYSPHGGSEDAKAVIAAVTRLLIAGYRLGMPLRGAITAGEIDVVQRDE